MTYNEMANNIQKGEYESKIPYSKENREKHRIEENRVYDLFHEDLKNFAQEKLGKTLSDIQFSYLFNSAWEKGHSSGYLEVFYEMDSLVTLISHFLDN